MKPIATQYQYPKYKIAHCASLKSCIWHYYFYQQPVYVVSGYVPKTKGTAQKQVHSGYLPLQPAEPEKRNCEIELQGIIYFSEFMIIKGFKFAPLEVLLLKDFLLKNTLRGLSGTGINFPMAASGQLDNRICT